jgi:hypothetical protein
MATPIGGPSPQPPQKLPENAPTLNIWTAQLLNIEALVQDGNRSGAIMQINALISKLKAQQPQTSKIKAAIQDLYGARSALQAGAPVNDVMYPLENAWKMLA